MKGLGRVVVLSSSFSARFQIEAQPFLRTTAAATDGEPDGAPAFIGNKTVRLLNNLCDGNDYDDGDDGKGNQGTTEI